MQIFDFIIMPELPEVETIVQQLNQQIQGWRIIDVWSDSFRKQNHLTWPQFQSLVKGKKIKQAARRGKNILLNLEGDLILWIHLKLTGHLLVGHYLFRNQKWLPLEQGYYQDKENTFIHWVFTLEKQKQQKQLVLADRRRFAKVVLLTQSEFLKEKTFQKLGPDPLAKDFTASRLKEILKKTKGPIKQVLMNQEYLSGIGNIYANEILFEAKLNPFKKASELKEEEIDKLFSAIKKVLGEALKFKGTSAEDEAYRMLDGSPGSFSSRLKVYQREGEKCVRCQSIIKRAKDHNRSTFYCPHCQQV